MIRSCSRTALFAACGLALSGAALAESPDPNRVIVTFAPGSASQVENAVRGARGNVHHRFDELNAMAITVPPQALNGLRNNPNVIDIEQDAVRYPMAQTVPYGIPMVQAPDLVATGADGTGIKVCIIDSGIKANHEDFAGISMTGSASSGQSWNTDTCGHGTHVAGTIAAVNNTTGVVGVSPGKVSLHIVKVFDGASCAWSYASTLIAAAQNCQAAGAKVINMSLGGSTSSRTERQAFDNLNAAGVLSIAAAGNDGNNRSSYPASYDSVMSVAAVDSGKVKADFSQFNSQVEISGPGVDVLSTYPLREGGVTVAGVTYTTSPMEGSPARTVSGAIADGGRCTASGAWSGKVVLCERGDIAFDQKVLNAQSGGAVGVVVYNNVAGSFGGTLNGTVTTVPSVSMSQEDGQFLLANQLGSTASVSTEVATNVDGYAALSGTSMATPHVAGVAAIVWSSKPTATNTQVRAALTSTAEDLGAAGRDTEYGYGLVRAVNAAAALTGTGGGGTDPGAGAPTSLSGTKTVKGPNYTYSLQWSGGASTVDIFRNGTKVRSAISNTGSYSETVKNLSTATYKVCNAGSSTACVSITL